MKAPSEHPAEELVAFLRQRIIDSDGHWLWQGPTTKAGYGKVGMARREWYVHRLMYEAIVGPIPDSLELDHLEICLTRHCCNPEHLEPVTHAENMRRIARRRSGCNQGHPYQDGSYIVRRGKRECLICRRATANAYTRRRRREAGYVPPAERTHCPAGHEASATTTRIYIDAKGHKRRRCRPCEALRARKRRTPPSTLMPASTTHTDEDH